MSSSTTAWAARNAAVFVEAERVLPEMSRMRIIGRR